MNEDRSKKEIEFGSGSGGNTYRQYIRNKRKIAHCCLAAYEVEASTDQSATSLSGLLTRSPALAEKSSDLMLRPNNAVQIRFRGPDAKIKYTGENPNQIMSATEDKCGVEIWKGESFKGLRSSREWKSLSLNDEKR